MSALTALSRAETSGHVLFPCGFCGARLRAPSASDGARVRCTHCGQHSRVPKKRRPATRPRVPAPQVRCPFICGTAALREDGRCVHTSRSLRHTIETRRGARRRLLGLGSGFLAGCAATIAALVVLL